MQQKIERYTRACEDCVKFKEPHVEYGEVPPREALYQPFYELAVDSIGPWKIDINGVEYTFHALSMIDTVSTLTELSRLNDSSSHETARKTEQSWLYRYPRPVQCIFDAGTEFKGEFQEMLNLWGIKAKPTGVRNARANAVCERMHQTVGNLLRSLCYTNPPQNLQEAEAMVDHVLAIVSHALRSTVHRTHGLSPGATVFNRDMLLDIPYVADLIRLREKRQAVIDNNLRRENNQRRNHDYVAGDQCYELVRRRNETTRKLEVFFRGPYNILRVHTNGTITIQRTPTMTERVNIRNFRPRLD